MLMVEHFMAEAFNTEGCDFGADEQAEACMGLWAAKFLTHKKDYTLKNFTRLPLPRNSGQGAFNKAAPPEQAEFWFFIDQATTPGSMAWVCNLFGLDINRVRTQIQPDWRTIYANIKPMAFKAPSQAPLQLPTHAETVAKKNRKSFTHKFPLLADFKPTVSKGRNPRPKQI